MVEISTSLLSVEKEKVIKTIYNLETAKTDYFHIDVMDGIFVENDTTNIMLEYCDYLSNITNIPLDVHLMVQDIEKYINLFLPYNPNIITIHFEAVKDEKKLLELINYIKSNNCKVGISIKPNTDITKILHILNKIHLVLIMTVEPGKGGQKLINSTLEKTSKLSQYIKQNDLDVIIQCDGGINLDNIKLVKQAGAEIIVSGTGIINTQDYNETINTMKNI